MKGEDPCAGLDGGEEERSGTPPGAAIGRLSATLSLGHIGADGLRHSRCGARRSAHPMGPNADSAQAVRSVTAGHTMRASCATLAP